MHKNVGANDGESTPWFLTHDKHFEGLQLPFGCAVRYLPNKTEVQKREGKTVWKDKQAKWDARSRLGVFAGYRMKSGYEWSKRYLVWDLDAFVDANLRADVDFSQLKGVKPHEVRRIRKPPGDFSFPLLSAY